MITLESTPEIIDFTRWYLAVFYTFVAVFYTIRVITAKKNTQNEMVFAGARYCDTWWNHMTFRLFRVSIWMVCVFRLFFPATDNYLGMFASLEHQITLLLGLSLLTIGFLFTLIVHYSMKKKWRSGIDPKGPETLITDGFYRYSRNPIFVSVGLSQLGFFFALPSVFTLVCLVLGLFTLYKQTIAEEQHLVTIFHDDYKVYQRKVRRWF